jgi:hypothetical protein
VLRTQLETAAPHSIEEDFVSTDSNTGPRTEVCFSHKVGLVLPSKVVFQLGAMFQLGFVFQLGLAFQKEFAH